MNRQVAVIITNLLRYPSAIIRIYGVMLGVSGIVLGTINTTASPTGTIINGFLIWYVGLVMGDVGPYLQSHGRKQ